MVRIGLLSDTHGHLPVHLPAFFKDVDEIWHAGDVGTPAVMHELEALKPSRMVYGNIDGQDIRRSCSQHLVFTIEGLQVLMMHIGGYPGRYEPEALALIRKYQPGLFISGHSHILKIMPDDKYKLLHINPGAAGIYGMHQFITMVRFGVEEGRVMDVEVSEAPKRR